MTSNRLVWLCRRGSRELDLLLQGYLARAYDAARPEERALFADLLQRRDEDLRALLLGSRRDDDPAQTELIERIRAVAAHHAHTLADI